MELWVVDKDTMCKIDLIRTYTYVQYVDEFLGEGSFQINLPATDEAVPYLVFGNYIIFDVSEGIVGVIKTVEDSQEEMNEIIITGKLSNHLLGYRSIPFTERYNGSITSISRTLVDKHFINPQDSRRKSKYVRLATDEQYIPEGPEISLCETGEPIRGVISSMFLPYGYGFKFYPILTDLDIENGIDRNIDAFEFRVIKPVDRTIGNEEGNVPVVFAFQLNNVSRLDLTDEGDSYATTAIVAGEGEGSLRKLVEYGDLEASGFDRIELYVDARDIQSDGKVSNSNIIKEMQQRGAEKLEEHKRFTTFDAGVLIEENNSYTYGNDFTIGDWVSIIDDKTGEVYDLQVSSVTRSILEGIEHFDITFGIDSVSMDSISSSGFVSSGGGGSSGGGESESEEKIVSWEKSKDGQYKFRLLSDSEADETYDGYWVSTNTNHDNTTATSEWTCNVPYSYTSVKIPWAIISATGETLTIKMDGEVLLDKKTGIPDETGRTGVLELELSKGEHTLSASYVKDNSPITYLPDEARIWLNDFYSFPQHTTVKVEVDSTITGEPGTSAFVENIGDDVNVKLKFIIPRGQRGSKGDKGDDGLNAYQIAVNDGFEGTYKEWLESLHGIDGLNGRSAYELALDNGFIGSETEWLASLKGPKGDPGGYVDANVFITKEEVMANTEYGNLVDAMVVKGIYEEGVGGGGVTVLGYEESLEYLNSETEEDPSGGEIVGVEILSYDDTLEFLNSEE